MIPIHTSDLLEKLDRVLSQPYLAPADLCGWCSKVLTGTEASLDFCDYGCQLAWQYGQSDGPMDDGGRGDWLEPSWGACAGPCCSPLSMSGEVSLSLSVERDRWTTRGLGRAYDAHVRFVENERARNVDLAAVVPQTEGRTSANRYLSALARWLGVDPDR